MSAPMIATWQGVPLRDLPPDRLIEIIVDQANEIATLRQRECARSIQHVNDMARIARRNANRTLLERIFG